jgi:hypothetical protein
MGAFGIHYERERAFALIAGSAMNAGVDGKGSLGTESRLSFDATLGSVSDPCPNGSQEVVEECESSRVAVVLAVAAARSCLT